MKVSLIVAMAAHGVIGRDGGLPWHLPADLARFKRLTMGHHLIVGRKTWESIGRPLPGRRMVVVTRDPTFAVEGVESAESPEAALELVRAAGEEEAFVAGGADLYRALLPRADRIYLTEIEAEVAGDVHFPEWQREGWRRVAVEERAADDRNRHPLRFEVWERRS
ncbi:MAG TPA: dihydrofolate reductase [Thermoanaerobaculia bacterium]|nr:dihydrofolate reductase [Thermoanaerobaculia bacterium]